MNLKVIMVFSLLCLLSLSVVVASDVKDIYFEITPPNGYCVDHCSDSSIFMRENKTGDVITIFEVNGNTSSTGYENVIEPHISNTIELSCVSQQYISYFFVLIRTFRNIQKYSNTYHTY